MPHGGTIDGGTVVGATARPVPDRLRAALAARDARLKRAASPAGDEDAAALEEFLAALAEATGSAPGPARPAAAGAARGATPGTVVPLPRGAVVPRPAADGAAGGPAGTRATGPRPGTRADPGDLALLPGAGPGLCWLLARCGVADLATLASLEPAALAARLGPVARLIDLPSWIAVARATVAEGA